MEEIKFKSVTELYERLLPALTTKVNELKLENIKINELELWNYLRKENWSSANNLSLNTMVNDIFKLDIEKLLVKRKNTGEYNDNNRAN